MVQLIPLGRICRPGHRGERGAVAVMVALMMLTLITCAALVLDIGMAKDIRRQSQNASDASALAAANQYYLTSDRAAAEAKAKEYARLNYGVALTDWPSCVDTGHLAVVASNTDCISFDANSATKVRVVVPVKQVSTIFGGVLGRSAIPVGSLAEVQLGRAVNCSLCFLGDVSPGNGDLSVYGGSIAVNGNVDTGPNSVWTAVSNGVHGTVTGGATFTPAVTSIPAFGDPLASLTLPFNTTGLTAKTNPCSSGPTGGPGLYGSFSLPNSLCTLQPGLYVISGTWDMKNNTVLAGAGVTLYVRSPNGALDFKNGNVAISAPATGVSAGYAIVYDRDNLNDLSLQGNGSTSITGITYAPSSILSFNGNSCFGFSGGPIVLKGASTNGNQSCVTVTNAVDTTVSRTKQYLSR